MNTYLVLWPNDWCNLLEKAGDVGPLKVVYGGPHISVPSLGKVKNGDMIYPVRVKAGCLYVLGRMKVEKIIDADSYLAQQAIIRPKGMLWDTASKIVLKQYSGYGHQIPRNCVDDAAIGIEGTSLRFDFPFPSVLLSDLCLGPRPGDEKPLNLKDGKVSHVNLQGHFRRLSEGSVKLFDEIMKGFEKNRDKT